MNRLSGAEIRPQKREEKNQDDPVVRLPFIIADAIEEQFYAEPRQHKHVYDQKTGKNVVNVDNIPKEGDSLDPTTRYDAESQRQWNQRTQSYRKEGAVFCNNFQIGKGP